MADPSINTNRRNLLLGVGATALAGTILSPKQLAADTDPACNAYLRTLKARAGVEDCDPEQFPERMVTLWKVQDDLATTPAKSLKGVYCKLNWLTIIENWEEDDGCLESQFCFSILEDLQHLMGEKR